MPTRRDYEGLTLPDALERFAEHHYEGRTRHISGDEYDLLLAAVEALRAAGVSHHAFP